jgi:Ca2+-binding EF-hand superfamily protein
METLSLRADWREGPEKAGAAGGLDSAADGDGDGFVTKDEFAHYYQRSEQRSPSPQNWEAFRSADLNGDGRISKGEFARVTALDNLNRESYLGR